MPPKKEKISQQIEVSIPRDELQLWSKEQNQNKLVPVQVPLITDEAAYFSFCNAQAYLSADEEAHYAERLKNHNDLSAAKSLILAHLRLVLSIVREYGGYGLPREDLIQEGNVGLMKAVRGFIPDRGARLATYATAWIKAQIQEYILNNWRLVKIGSTKNLKKLFFNLRALQMKLTGTKEQESTQRIAQELKVSVDEIATAEEWFNSTSSMLDVADVQDAELVHSSSASAEIQVMQKDAQAKTKLAIDKALNKLNEREQAIFSARHLQPIPATLRELSECHSISMERVRQIESQATQKLRDELKSIRYLMG